MTSENKALRLVKSLRRGKSEKTDMELLEDYQVQMLGVLSIVALLFSISLAMAFAQPEKDYIFLILPAAISIYPILQIGNCISAKRLLIEKRRFDF